MVLELGEELETRLEAEARHRGQSVQDYVSATLESVLPRRNADTSLLRHEAAVDALATFAQRHATSLPPGITVKDLLEEGRM